MPSGFWLPACVNLISTTGRSEEWRSLGQRERLSPLGKPENRWRRGGRVKQLFQQGTQFIFRRVAKKRSARPPSPARRVAVGSGIMEEGSSASTRPTLVGVSGRLLGASSAREVLAMAAKKAERNRIERI